MFPSLMSVCYSPRAAARALGWEEGERPEEESLRVSAASLLQAGHLGPPTHLPVLR